MANLRVPMSKLREILRLKCVQRLSNRVAARSAGVSAGTVCQVMTRAKSLGLTWAAAETLTDDALETRIYGPRAKPGTQRPEPDLVHLHNELRRPGVTLELLHLEYLAAHPDGLRYSAFCERYRSWLARRCPPSMRQVHKAGDKLFTDYSGKRPRLVDPQTGETREVEMFVAVLGASSLTYVEATETQRVPDWLGSHVRAFEALGGAPAMVVSDQLRSAVTRPGAYEVDLQRSYAELGRHYNVALLPARPRKPKDKAKVEAGVLMAQRWILARLRNEQHHDLASLNARIRELCRELNDRPMKRLDGRNRQELFEALDRPALQSLPAEPFEYSEWSKAKVGIDYHVVVQKHFYSAPYTLVREVLMVRRTVNTVELFHNGLRVASHRRTDGPGFTTETEHMPPSHRAHAEWTPARLIHWGSTIGPLTERLVAAILESRQHPEQGYRACLGIIRLGRHYGHPRLEAAAGRALEVGARGYRSVESILKRGLDLVPVEQPVPDRPSHHHENVRGAGYYQ